eukprot:m.92257 g.92257  ORF g.92257 m.92257 type:complete len:637 (+) comp14660_c0_seq1:35-1945(+)
MYIHEYNGVCSVCIDVNVPARIACVRPHNGAFSSDGRVNALLFLCFLFLFLSPPFFSSLFSFSSSLSFPFSLLLLQSLHLSSSIPHNLKGLHHLSYSPFPPPIHPPLYLIAVLKRADMTTAETSGVNTPPSISHALLVDSTLEAQADNIVGGLSFFGHTLINLGRIGIKRVVVVTSKSGVKYLESCNDCFDDHVQVKIVEMDKDWTGAEVKALLQAASTLGNEPFIFVNRNHAHDPYLLAKMASVDNVMHDDGAACLIEHDVEGMVGLSKSTIFGAWPALQETHVAAVGTNLKAYNGVFAGLAAFPGNVVYKAKELYAKQPSADLSTLLNEYAREGSLQLVKNEDNHIWLSGLTSESKAFSEKRLKQEGTPLKLKDGTVVKVLGSDQQMEDPSRDWSLFTVEKWRNAVFTTKSFFGELYTDTHHFIKQQIEALGGRDNVCLVEVGCGTGDTLLPLSSHAKYCIGVDINEDFIKYCQTQNTSDNVRFLCGDATKLPQLLASDKVKDWTSPPLKRLVICVGNTIGIIPEFLREAIYRNMAEVAGRDGMCVVVYWNGNCFGEAVQHFYYENPQLCGQFQGKHVDFQQCTLRTPSGYSTKWTKPEEASQILKSLNLEELQVVEKKRGVMAVFRQPEAPLM